MNFISFLRWKFSKWTKSDWLYWIGLTLILIGVATYDHYGKLLIIAGIAIWTVGIMIFFVWKNLKKDYQTFLKERSSLFITIKESDK